MTLPDDYFDDLYARSDDPWGFRTRWYETRKRNVVLACLLSERYSTGFEPGCSIGVTTASLAARVDHLVAMDVASHALEQARHAAIGGGVDFRLGRVPADWPDEHFDLVVISEVAYYSEEADCRKLAELACGSADELLVVHWRHPVADYPLRGDAVQKLFAAAATDHTLKHQLSHVEADFRIDSWSRDHRSPAARAALLP